MLITTRSRLDEWWTVVRPTSRRATPPVVVLALALLGACGAAGQGEAPEPIGRAEGPVTEGRRGRP